MKKKILLSSMVTIVLCLCLIAGSTFALFTDREVMNIAVTSGTVDITAAIAKPVITSATPAGDSYDYPVQPVTVNTDGTFEGSFLNGGTVEYAVENDVPVLAINKITPGDAVKFQITGTNESDVNIKYRCVIELVDGNKEFFDGKYGLQVIIDGVEYEYQNGPATSDWVELEFGASTDIVFHTVEIKLPIEAGNEYQGLEAKLNVTLEAVQGNANVK